MVYNILGFVSMKQKDQNKIKKNQPVWKGTARFLKLFFKKPKIVSLSGDLPQKAIYVANHEAMFGPLVYNLYMPATVAPWGAYPMLGKWKQRYRYLKDVYFIQKRHKNKFVATILAAFEACFSGWFYKGLRVIPSYNDQRFIATLHKSMQVLDNDIGVLVFPENSNEGYHEKMTEFFAGFVYLAKYYRKRHGEDIPIYPVYYHSKLNKMVIGYPSYYSDYEERGLDRKQIAAEFCRQVNELLQDHVKNSPAEGEPQDE